MIAGLDGDEFVIADSLHPEPYRRPREYLKEDVWLVVLVSPWRPLYRAGDAPRPRNGPGWFEQY